MGLYHATLLFSPEQTELRRTITAFAKLDTQYIGNVLNALTAKPETFYIDIAFKNYRKLAATRERAMQRGYLVVNEEDWVPARIEYQGKRHKVALRLKGDRPDHWQHPTNWSFKVKVRQGKTLLGMRRFSLQHPERRVFANEWLLHQLFKYTGLIGHRFQFLRVVLNGKALPIYALEENIDKRLIENNQRRNGPVFRFQTSPYLWQVDPRLGFGPMLHAAQVTPFQYQSLQKDPLLKQELNRGLALLQAFQRGNLPSRRVFDQQKTARYFALLDLIGNHHASGLDNSKLYYNPITARLEPVVYDGEVIYPTPGRSGLHGWGHAVLSSGRSFTAQSRLSWGATLFKDPDFFSTYIKALEEISQPAFLDAFLTTIEEPLLRMLATLHQSYPWYQFDHLKTLKENQQAIQRILNSDKIVRAQIKSDPTSANQVMFDLYNQARMPVEVLGVINARGNIDYWPKPIWLPGDHLSKVTGLRRSAKSSITVPWRLPEHFLTAEEEVTSLHLLARLLGAEKTVKIVLSEPFEHASQETLLKEPTTVAWLDQALPENVQLDREKKQLTILSGRWSLTQPLSIPETFHVVVHPGVTIDLKNQAWLQIRGALHLLGEAEQPIFITSSDRSGQGIVIENTSQQSRWRHVQISHLHRAKNSVWGAIHFEKASLDAYNVQFSTIRAPSILKIIATDFALKNIHWHNLEGTALSIKQASGQLDQSQLQKIDGDGLHIDAGYLILRTTTINNTESHAVHVLREGMVEASDVHITQAPTGWIAENGAKVYIRTGSLSHVESAVVAFCSHPSFIRAQIIYDQLNLDHVKYPLRTDHEGQIFYGWQLADKPMVATSGALSKIFSTARGEKTAF
ncbi:CotH kinase family protein [Magnetococcales bacterium HHB-1]